MPLGAARSYKASLGNLITWPYMLNTFKEKQVTHTALFTPPCSQLPVHTPLRLGSTHMGAVPDAARGGTLLQSVAR